MTDIAIANQLSALINQWPMLTRIEDADQYHKALALVDELVGDYDRHKRVIELLSASIEEWEDRDPELEAFNQSLSELDGPRAVMRCLMDQHGLKMKDFPEIGGQSLISRLMNPESENRFTMRHIQALIERFKLPPAIFF